MSSNIYKLDNNLSISGDLIVSGTNVDFTGVTNILGIDHSDLTSIGTNTHTQIDTHIADGTIHFTEGSINHGNISGLADDDHTQYALLLGRGGGQELHGGTGASENLTLESTSNVAKGEVFCMDPLRCNDIDARTATTLLLGKAYATKVEIADSGVTTEVQGILGVNTTADSTYALTCFNGVSTNGIKIMAGENLGDISLHIANHNDTVDLLELETDQGYLTLGKTYAQTLTDNGTVYGVDNQHTGNAKDFNTQAGGYRIGGQLTMDTTYYQNGISNGISTTTSTSFQQKLRITTPSLPSGDYRIGWTCAIKNSSGGPEIRVQLNDTTTIVTSNGPDSSTPEYITMGGVHYANTISGIQNIDLDYRSISGTTNIKETKLEIWKV